MADLMFGSQFAGRPVYALPDGATLRAVIAAADLDDEAGETDADKLATVVRSTLPIEELGVSPFRLHESAARSHKRERLEVPPALPLLVLLAVVAERMHADSKVAANNYYTRLHQLLKVPQEHQLRFESGYRKSADLLWGSLNSWLEAWDGERGIPTAYAVGGHAFIGLPLSQALVRQHDRNGLHELFAREGFTPGVRISPADMSAAVDPYATTTPSPLSSHLSRLWRIAAARERIVDAACLELETWDGSGLERFAAERQVALTRLLAFLRTFPRPSLEFNLMLPYRSEGPGVASFLLMDGEVEVPTVAGPGGSTRLSDVSGVSALSLVDEQLEGRFGDISRTFGRRPKRVTPLRWDSLQGAFVETERISIGEDSVVVARVETRSRVDKYLAKHARPGWIEQDAVPGLPGGWTIYRNVQITSVPTETVHADLLPLAPRTQTSLTLRGGFVLPGFIRKWSTLEPPEVVGLAAGATEVEVRVYQGHRIDAKNLVAEKSWPGELVVLPLAPYALMDDEYVVAMFVDGAQKAASTAIMRLRSADTPQLRLTEADLRLVYSPQEASTWVMSAGAAGSPAHINGARLHGPVPSHGSGSSSIPPYAPRQRKTEQSVTKTLRVGVPVGTDSCLITGLHRFVLPPVLPGQVRTRRIEGECETCGMVRRFAGTVGAARKKDGKARLAQAVIDLPPVLATEATSLATAFDALNHVGAGSVGAFERIAAQVEGSGLFADTFLRRLEVEGHIDVSRNGNLRATEWAMNAPTLMPVGDKRWVLVGGRSRVLVEKLREGLGSDGHLRMVDDAGLVRIEVEGENPPQGLEELGFQVLVVSPAAAIAAALPPLSKVAEALRRTVVPRHRTAEFWDTGSASWQPASTLARPGAYRLKDFAATYAVRSRSDIEQGTLGIGNAQIVKHVANMWANDPLVGYHAPSSSVVTALGADLPGLFGRALALCSGKAPREIPAQRMLQYQDVPQTVADIVFDRLSR